MRITTNTELLEQQENRICLRITAPSELLYFQGHFPENPILPGVVQIHWAIKYAREYFNMPSHFAGMEVIKFQQIARPEQPLTLVLSYNPEKQKLTFSYNSATASHSSGRILWSD